ncbi:hypothetical protein [Schleiferia thermophila]|jgi:hypothetical protein|uniref:hypothetical protein n=1 Tax=Schleiferia thermophila TaxID=884107 RepID=UPI0004E69A68|nr:hypothetical protein [Schleiferia thermophila]KFD38843.1 hypothetical protein AT05_07985 [Schleiferia thermophila str. Yellowstone]PMB35868.1 hypothetical protein CEN47_08795 [Fischerella thermalis CCMEE 5319]
MKGHLLTSCFYLMLLITAASRKEKAGGFDGLWLDWKGFIWQVKRKENPVGPGPNYFGMDHRNVSISKSGDLVLSIEEVDSLWSCAEVFSITIFGNGLFLFEVEGLARELHPQAVLGMFTFNENEESHFNESDVEVSRWGQPDNPNAQFAHYSLADTPELHRFELSKKSNLHTFILAKHRGEVSFYYLDRKHGLKLPDVSKAKAFQRYSNLTHSSGSYRIHINLWLFKGEKPMKLNKKNVLKVRIKNFMYQPLAP